MFHFFDVIQDRAGNSLPGYFVALTDSDGAIVDLFADENGTPIESVSGEANKAKTEDAGNVSLFVADGNYNLNVYAPDATTLVYQIENVAMMTGPQGPKGDKGDPGSIENASDANIGSVNLNGLNTILDHLTFSSNRDASKQTRIYAQPPAGETLGHTYVISDVITSFTAFGDPYDAMLKATADGVEGWTGAHYRDGGVSLFVDTSPPVGDALVPAYSPAGHVSFNAKNGGNQWPFSPSAGMGVSQKPWITVFEVPVTAALPGPTFAGGGVYPCDRWRPQKEYAVGDLCHYYGRVYEITVAGTSGTFPPMHDGISGKRADAWDVALLTTVGTLETRGSGDFYVGTDSGTGGGTVEYALIEQLYPQNLDNIMLLGPGLEVNPLLALGDATQLAGPLVMIGGESTLVVSKRNADGTGSGNGCGLYPGFDGTLRYGYSTTKGLLARASGTTDLKFDGVSVSYSEKVKPDGATTVDVTGANIVKFNDSAPTTVTAITGGFQGQEITFDFNNSNTTIQHSGTGIRIPGGQSITPGSNDSFKVTMRSATIGNAQFWVAPVTAGSTGWTAGTGTANKGAFTSYAGTTQTGSYVQADVQATDDAVKAASQRILALEQALFAYGIIAA